MAALSAGSLSRYFSGGGPDGGGSNFGAMCERAALDANKHASIQCRPCGGNGFVVLTEDDLEGWKIRIADGMKRLSEEPDHEQRKELHSRLDDIRQGLSQASVCEICKGSGYTTQKRADRAVAMDSMFTTVRCGRCRATGTDRNRGDALRLILGDKCGKCGGEAYVVPVTAKEHGSSKSGKPPKKEPSTGADDNYDGPSPTNGVAAASWVDEDALAERGRVSRVLDAIRRENPAVGQAIATYNGPDGDKWGQNKWGRLFALWQHTEAGKQLALDGAKRSKGGHGFLIAPLELIATERDAEFRALTPNPRRRALISQADRQARELHTSMTKAIRSSEAA